MKVYMERQSVSMRDDKKAPNRQMFEILENCRIKDFIKILIKNYCPKVNSKKAAWVLLYKDKTIAVFDSVSKKYSSIYNENIILKDLLMKNEKQELYLYYKGDEDINYIIESESDNYHII
ncbi:MAG: hypothetical protein PUE01_09935 [Clostridiaceae bacterium]|nr:hypothetical protein [Clostridiaceae bacterium]